ncbi:hypothetical protein AR457_14255 [Streptomyces agglomeratus]|uniref:hypothetical protein n=1 Tax=Streptomyces agglomeratus TaxID=285458 RepID=UPI00085507D4|nr:hypothetical protein [Streptomyces agglomeratus]OEJ40514.1 hypothetical protein BGK70_22395 [Streptomyces agglomeratus]OEJ45105.1 hypothetical protein AR457_14255 [Streptomyces agglomeratus]
MNRFIRTAVCAAAVAGLAFGLGACSEATEAVKDEAAEQVDKSMDEKYEVTYEVTGKGVESIEFSGGKGTAMDPKMETVKKPTLPWKKTVTLRGIMPPAVSPISLTDTADLTCKVVYKGETIKEATGEKALLGCIAVSPIVK